MYFYRQNTRTWLHPSRLFHQFNGVGKEFLRTMYYNHITTFLTMLSVRWKTEIHSRIFDNLEM